jgi:hypothetical protein
LPKASLGSGDSRKQETGACQEIEVGLIKLAPLLTLASIFGKARRDFLHLRQDCARIHLASRV